MSSEMRYIHIVRVTIWSSIIRLWTQRSGPHRDTICEAFSRTLHFRHSAAACRDFQSAKNKLRSLGQPASNTLTPWWWLGDGLLTLLLLYHVIPTFMENHHCVDSSFPNTLRKCLAHAETVHLCPSPSGHDCSAVGHCIRFHHLLPSPGPRDFSLPCYQRGMTGYSG